MSRMTEGGNVEDDRGGNVGDRRRSGTGVEDAEGEGRKRHEMAPLQIPKTTTLDPLLDWIPD